MDRSLQLRRQLSRLVELRFGTEPGWRGCDVAGALRPPSSKQSDALRQVSWGVQAGVALRRGRRGYSCKRTPQSLRALTSQRYNAGTERQGGGGFSRSKARVSGFPREGGTCGKWGDL